MNRLLLIVVFEQIWYENTEGQKALVLWPAFDVFMALSCAGPVWKFVYFEHAYHRRLTSSLFVSSLSLFVCGGSRTCGFMTIHSSPSNE